MSLIAYVYWDSGMAQWYGAALPSVKTWVQAPDMMDFHCRNEFLILILAQKTNNPHYEVDH